MIAVIFEVTPTTQGKAEYLAIAAKLKSQLEKIEGFISIERFQSLTNENKVLSLSYWRDEQAVIAWREQSNHQQAQSKGQQSLFEDYRICVATVKRDYGLTDRMQAPQ
ncbi:antibiotic biosynthesis monooxygenase [Colwelliaceae bacterium 6441]